MCSTGFSGRWRCGPTPARPWRSAGRGRGRSSSMLLLNAGRVVTVERLVAGQYGDAPPADAVNAVQAQVSRLRKAIPGIEFHGGGYRLEVDPDDVDALRFERLAALGRGRLAAGDHRGARGTLREALALWRGTPLADLPHAGGLAARLEELRLTPPRTSWRPSWPCPRAPRSPICRRLVADHPLRERLRGQLMRALHAAGRQAEALAEYDDVRRLLADELGADPSPSWPRSTWRSCARTPRRPRRAPAAQLTTFVGRARERARLEQLRDARLVTHHRAGRHRQDPPGDRGGRAAATSCFADLSPRRRPRARAARRARRARGARGRLRRPPRPVRPPGSWARSREDPLLLILDNCEHVVDGRRRARSDLLAACPGAHDRRDQPRAARADRRDAAAAARRSTPGLRRGPAVRRPARAARCGPASPSRRTTADAVAEICAALDGLPLAIELAAARLRQFTVGELAARLAEHGPFRLLSRGDRTAAARHRTLRRRGRLELGAARRGGAGGWRGGSPCSPAARRSPRSRRCAATTDDVLADLVDRSLLETDGAPLPDARDHPPVLRGEAGRVRRGRRVRARARRPLPRRWRSGPTRTCAAPSSSTGSRRCPRSTTT